MSDTSLIELARAGLEWAALGLLPTVAIACAAAAVFGVLAHQLGLVDVALSTIVRAAAVGVALYLVGAEVVAGTRLLTERSWGALADVGGGLEVQARPAS